MSEQFCSVSVRKWSPVNCCDVEECRPVHQQPRRTPARLSRGSGLRRKCGAGDRYGSAFSPGQSFHPALSCCASALTIPVPSPVFGCAKTPSGLPIPLSATESFQFSPAVSYPTIILPSLLSLEMHASKSSLRVCDNQAEALSVTGIRIAPFAHYLQRNRPMSPIIEVASLSHSLER